MLFKSKALIVADAWVVLTIIHPCYSLVVLVIKLLVHVFKVIQVLKEMVWIIIAIEKLIVVTTVSAISVNMPVVSKVINHLHQLR